MISKNMAYPHACGVHLGVDSGLRRLLFLVIPLQS